MYTTKRTNQRNLPLIDRFYSKVKVPTDEVNECWIWTGSTSKNYGEIQVKIGNTWKSRRATHVSWFLFHGEWPVNWMCHTCDNRSCVNPHHLYDGTVTENNQDIHERYRLAYEVIRLQRQIINQLLKE